MGKGLPVYRERTQAFQYLLDPKMKIEVKKKKFQLRTKKSRKLRNDHFLPRK